MPVCGWSVLSDLMIETVVQSTVDPSCEIEPPPAPWYFNGVEPSVRVSTSENTPSSTVYKRVQELWQLLWAPGTYSTEEASNTLPVLATLPEPVPIATCA